MTNQLAGQLDLLDLLIPEAPAVDRDGLIGWTYYETGPDKLDALHQAWVDAYSRAPWSEWRKFPGWHEERTGRNALKDSAHTSFTYWADLGCHHWREATVEQRLHGYCQCVGRTMLYRAYCAGCGWWTPTETSENDAAEAYLDHCWPGWRELPVLEELQGKYKLPADYPQAWQTPGAPVRDCRGRTQFGTRHVPGGSPFGGYKAAAVQDCDTHADFSIRQQRKEVT